MGGPLQRLVYCSRSRLDGSDRMLTREIGLILASCQRNNPLLGVTGALLFNGGCFGQVLEGPRAAVEATFERIQRDERHGDVTLLQFAAVEHRGFAAWSMAFVGQSVRHQNLFGGIGRGSGFDLSALAGERLFEVLRNLVLEQEAASPA